MKKDMQKKIEEIKLEKKIPEELKNETKKKILYNFLMATAIILYFIFLILGSENSAKTMRTIDFNIFSLILLGISIILFEKAYKKDSGTLALHGIEILIVGLVTLFFTYIVFELNKTQRIYFYMIGVYFAIYYIIKSIFIENKAKKIYKKTKIENMKEVIEPVLAEKRESLRKTKNKKINDQVIDLKEVKKITKIKKEERKNKKIKENEIIEQPVKKRGRPKKNENNIEIEKLDKKTKEASSNVDKAMPQKKRERPKKIVENRVTGNLKTQQEVSKKRGRPRKVVS